MEILTVVAAWAIMGGGFLFLAGILLFAVRWAWVMALYRTSSWHTIMLLTAKALHGEKYNKALVLPALKEWVGDSDMRAYSALRFIRDLRPNAESILTDDHVEEEP